jgi:hypothetical protein
MIEDLAGDWRRLDERIDCVTEEIERTHPPKTALPNLGAELSVRL